MAFPVTATFTLNYPPDEGMTPDDLPYPVTMSVEQREIKRFVFTGAGAKVVDFGTIGGAGAKIVFVYLEPGTGVLPIEARYNGGGTSGSKEISPGGMDILVSPGPVGGITSLELVYTAACKVKIWLFG
jgi:hypothetical protein